MSKCRASSSSTHLGVGKKIWTSIPILISAAFFQGCSSPAGLLIVNNSGQQITHTVILASNDKENTEIDIGAETVVQPIYEFTIVDSKETTRSYKIKYNRRIKEYWNFSMFGVDTINLSIDEKFQIWLLDKNLEIVTAQPKEFGFPLQGTIKSHNKAGIGISSSSASRNPIL